MVSLNLSEASFVGLSNPTARTMAITWLTDVTNLDIKIAGGKGASLGELTNAGFPVPPGFIVLASTYRDFITQTGMGGELLSAVDIDVHDSNALVEANLKATNLILEAELPISVQDEILLNFDKLNSQIGKKDLFVAVRSSATAEDLPDASFAGQQDTYLNISRSDLVDKVKDCWASLFTQRAIYYRSEKGFKTLK